jgi:hypothetical protein
MTERSKTTLKGYFNTGDIPTETNFADMIDSFQRQSFIDIRDYGTVGDGETDDTTAIQAAIDAAGTGGSVYIPHGRYKIGDSLLITNPIKIFGSGRGVATEDTEDISSEIYFVATDKEAAIIIASRGVSISDVCLVGNKSIDGATTGIGILLKGTETSQFDGISIERIAVLNFIEHGIVVRNTVFMTSFYNVHCNRNSGYGLLCESPDGGINGLGCISCVFTSN